MAIEAASNLLQLQLALAVFALHNDGGYPDTLGSLTIPYEEGCAYLDNPKFLLDPWGRPVHHEPLSEGREFLLYILGADGAPGGEGEVADIYPPGQGMDDGEQR